MASKSKRAKRRRRVLAASCILAALIVAGSSFAWFTSKDEVTNRLSASADYGVSIVESFSPPANWLPGQTVNKDVYDVNTGNIAAFVKNDITGVLNYTYESKTSTRTDDCIKLNELEVTSIDGVTSSEGGGFLAYAKADDNTVIDVGAVNSARKNDAVANTWHPSKAGVYIFRRSIGGTAAAPTYTYAGYYFNGEKDYYKIVIGDDKYRAESQTAGTPNKVVFDLATPESAITGIEIDRTDGSFTGDPKIWYVKDTKVENQAVSFKLDDTNKRLIVEYAPVLATVDDNQDVNGTNVTVTYDAVADAARKEVDYINKLGISNSDTIAYNQAKADYDYEKALADAANDLYAAAITRNTAHSDFSNAGSGLTTAWNTLTAQVETTRDNYLSQKSTFESGLTVNTLVPAAVQTAITGNASLTQCQADLAEMIALQTEIASLVNEINNTYDIIRTETTVAGKSAEEVETVVNNCKIKLTALKAKLTAYSNAYAGLTNNATVASALQSQGISDISAKKTALSGIVSYIDSTLINSLDSVVSAYRAAWDTNVTQTANEATAQNTWREAIIAYNTAVTDAKDAYDSAIARAVPTPQDPTRTVDNYTDNGTTIVRDYAAQSITAGSDPTIVVADAETQYETYAGYSNRTAPDTSVYTDLETTMNSSVNNTKDAKDAYDEAVLKLDSSSKITIYVNLDASYGTNWTLDARKLETDTTKATFYLNKILKAGDTSAKLIDSVTFADTVTARDYKDLTFDLNVGLDSAQITYADDQKTIMTDAVSATGSAFTMKPTLTTPTDINTAIRWDEIVTP